MQRRPVGNDHRVEQRRLHHACHTDQDRQSSVERQAVSDQRKGHHAEPEQQYARHEHTACAEAISQSPDKRVQNGKRNQRYCDRSHELGAGPPEFRSEEHTSELQSLMRITYAVFCLKKTKHMQPSPEEQNRSMTKNANTKYN